MTDDDLPEDSLLGLFVADYQVTDGTFGPDLTPFKQGWPWEGRLFDPSFFGLSYQTPLSYLPEPEHQSFAIPNPGEPYATQDELGPCGGCEHCTDDGRADCVKADHPRCPTCEHCAYRHKDQGPIWEALLNGMLAQVLAVEPVTYPQGVIGFEATMTGSASYRLTMTLADGSTVSSERSLTP